MKIQKELDKLPRAISRLSSLLAPSKRVRFDLDGTGREQKLSWVGPETAVQCWDPVGTGKISSGKQLFGSVTWWMFWRDGSTLPTWDWVVNIPRR
ncbi:hypothetical protein [Armatimonas sp.]|uniref:hypothetical protein n=1 Tax=Armatimonas sp. TaxID=1872638 RepID=UPI00374CC481